MPIAIDEPYRTYDRLRREGRLKLPAGKLCPRDHTATLALTSTEVERGLIVFQQDRAGEWSVVKLVILVVLARCALCNGRFRVLPSDVPPHKTFGLWVIELECTAYVEGDRSLRDVVWGLLPGRTPAHTTLHAWTEGMGAWALGREPGEVPGTESFGGLLAETQKRWPREVEAVFEQRVSVDPRRYRSEERRERLAAVVRVFAVATSIAAESDQRRALCFWFQLAQTAAFGLTSPVSFRTGLSFTPFELSDPAIPEDPGPTSHLRGSRCPTNTRSPPGASSKSLRYSMKASAAPQDAARYGTGPSAKSVGLMAGRSASVAALCIAG